MSEQIERDRELIERAVDYSRRRQTMTPREVADAMMQVVTVRDSLGAIELRRVDGEWQWRNAGTKQVWLRYFLQDEGIRSMATLLPENQQQRDVIVETTDGVKVVGASVSIGNPLSTTKLVTEAEARRRERAAWRDGHEFARNWPGGVREYVLNIRCPELPND